MTLTVEQLELRKSGIGASEIAAIMGLDPFKTALSVFYEKRGLTEPPEETEPMYWGSAIEPVIYDRYIKQAAGRDEIGGGTGHFHAERGEMRTIRHPDYPFMLCTPDGAILRPGRPPVMAWGVEIKNKSAFVAHQWGESGSTDVPFYVQLQCQWSMAVCGVDRWDVAVLIGGNDFRTYTLTRSEEVIANLIEVGRKFWNDLAQGIEPPAQAEDNERLGRMKRQTVEERITSTPALDEAARILAEVRERIKADEAIKDAMEATIKQAIGTHAGMIGKDWQATWKTSKPSSVVDWKAVATELCEKYLSMNALGEAVARHMTTKPGTRRFLFTPAKTEE